MEGGDAVMQSLSRVTKARAIGADDLQPQLVIVRAARYQYGNCIHFPTPVILELLGPGEELEAPECEFVPGEVLKYSAWDDAFPYLALSMRVAPITELVEEFATRGVSGDVEIRNVRLNGNRLCADVRMWAKISVLGREVKFDETREFCIAINAPCSRAWEWGGFAYLDVCYRFEGGQHKLCAELCAKKWGIGDCWEKCIGIDAS